MSEYTEEDFKNVRFAKHPDGRVAVRIVDNANEPWTLGVALWASGADMARAGWRPVHEHNPHATDALEEEIQDLRDEVRNLRESPLTLDALREAWENADRLRGCKQCDTLIERLDPDVDAFTIYRADYSANAQALPDTIRVLHRVPQPEPWQALAGLIEGIEDSDWTDRPDLLAKMLHERGVRVISEGESND